MTQIATGGVDNAGILQDDWSLTWLLSGGLTTDNIGAAMAIDTSANNTMKLAGSAMEVVGKLETVEVRSVEGVTVGTLTMSGVFKFGYTGTAPTVGAGIAGSAATPGKVVAVTAAAGQTSTVIAVDTTATTVTVIMK